jgi:AcrR family transcriptional regulator
MFAERGFHGVSVDDLGAALGVSGPALYHHFSSKQAVLAEMLIDISKRLLAEGTRRVETAPTPSEALDALVRWHVDFALNNPALITVQTRDLPNVPEDDRRRVVQLQRRYVELWVKVVCRLAPGADRDAAMSATHAAFGLINSTPHSARVNRDVMADLLHGMAVAALTSNGVLGRT